ncbi:MAG TPA: tetratricopeptide repeat protein [Pyrinomonadaceae bacterium]|nr:tetratricopeptide repeat protein [Pyrinomonadaceae bacterium]
MRNHSKLSQTAAAVLTFSVVVTAVAQDISGGAGALLASADVEAKLGKGIFTPVQSKPHVNKVPDKKPVRRTVASAHTRTNNTGNRTTNSGNNSGNRTSNGTKPAMDAEAYNKQGDDLFDTGKYDQAADAYQQAIKLRPDYAEAYLNLSETYFNLGRYDDAITAANKAILLNLNTADAYRTLGLAQLHKNNLPDAVTALKRAHDLNAADIETRSGLSLA